MTIKCPRPIHDSYMSYQEFVKEQHNKGKQQKQCWDCELWLFPSERKGHRMKK